MPSLYLELAQEIHKASAAKAPKAFIAARKEIHDAYEPKVLSTVQSALKRARRRMLTKRSDIETSLVKLHKSESDDIKAEVRKYLEAAFAGSAAELVDIESDLVDDLAKEFSSVYEVDIKYDVVNKKATEYLQQRAENYFSTLSDAQAQGLLDIVSDTLKSDDGYTIQDVAKNVLDEWLSNQMYFATDQGSRQIGTDTWALTVARTEVARSASYGQQAILESLDLKLWQWTASGFCCDLCQPNDDEIREIGNAFPSGDTESPAHPNCLCIMLPLQDEMESLGDDVNDKDDASD